jgi:hypothetical protein
VNNTIARRGPGARTTQGDKTAGTNSSASQWHRPPAGREMDEPNVEAGWSEGWPPRMAQHDRQTLKGNKPQERQARGSICRGATSSESAVQSIRPDERDAKSEPTAKKSACKQRTEAETQTEAQARRDDGTPDSSPARQPVTRKQRSIQANGIDIVNRPWRGCDRSENRTSAPARNAAMRLTRQSRLIEDL